MIQVGTFRIYVLELGKGHGDEVGDKLALVHNFFSGTGRTYDFIVNVATFGIDRLWKRIIVDALPADPKRVLDLACGTGILTFAIARRFPNCRVIGVELRDEYLQIARAKSETLGLNNVEFVLSRAEDFDSEESFDCVVSSYLAKYADLPLLTRNTARMLAVDGLLLMHDFTYPPNSILVGVWRLYFKTLQLVGTPFVPAWRRDFLWFARPHRALPLARRARFVSARQWLSGHPLAAFDIVRLCLDYGKKSGRQARSSDKS